MQLWTLVIVNDCKCSIKCGELLWHIIISFCKRAPPQWGSLQKYFHCRVGSSEGPPRRVAWKRKPEVHCVPRSKCRHKRANFLYNEGSSHEVPCVPNCTVFHQHEKQADSLSPNRGAKPSGYTDPKQRHSQNFKTSQLYPLFHIVKIGVGLTW